MLRGNVAIRIFAHGHSILPNTSSTIDITQNGQRKKFEWYMVCCKRWSLNRRIKWDDLAQKAAFEMTDSTKDSFRPNSRLSLRVVLAFIVLILGLIQTFATRYDMLSDSISYADMARFYAHGQWDKALSPHWSPFYPWLLGMAIKLVKPTPAFESTLFHIVNLGLCLAALVALDFLLQELAHVQHNTLLQDSEQVGFSRASFIIVGYGLFILMFEELVPIKYITPDLGVAAVVFAASALILRVRRLGDNWLRFVFLGVLLGVGYLVKTPLFLLAFLFLGAAALSSRTPRQGIRKALVALAIFLSISAPQIVAVSKRVHRLSFGESGRDAYIWGIDRTSVRTVPPMRGIAGGAPLHPQHLVLTSPTIYSYQGSAGGSYPVWYDPSYWYAGFLPRFSLRQHIATLHQNLDDLAGIVLHGQTPVLFAILLLIVLQYLCKAPMKSYLSQWAVVIPTGAALAMYAIILVSGRYVGMFLVILWVALLGSVRLPSSEISRKLLKSVALVVIMFLGFRIGSDLINQCRTLAAGEPNVQWRVAVALRDQFHLKAGNNVGFIGNGSAEFWAHLGGWRIMSEMPSEAEAGKFWGDDSDSQQRVLRAFASTGVAAIVTHEQPDGPLPAGWQRLGQTSYYGYDFK